jgi:hypothetical protein
LEGQIKNAAAPLFCKPKTLVAAVKDKIWVCIRIDDLEIQGERDRKKIEDIIKERIQLRNEKGLLNRQLENEKKENAWKNKALSRLEEANLTVKMMAKFVALARIRIDSIKKFFKKGDTNYKRIFDILSKFAADVEKALSDFSSALIPIKRVMHGGLKQGAKKSKRSKRLNSRLWGIVALRAIGRRER